jgi:hypothetical protein
MEKVLQYDRSIVPQETGWWCGPASCQVSLSVRGIAVPERDMMMELEALEGHPWVLDDQGGTNNIDQVATVLNRRIGGDYVVRSMPHDPPTVEEVDRLWDDLRRSVDNGFAMVCNIAVPPSNYPRGTRGSQSPAYGGGMVFHYFTAPGYADEGQGRHAWIADSGFRPYGYWCSIEQLASMIASKGYTCATKTVEREFLDALSPEDQQAVLSGFLQLVPRA